MGLPFLGWCLMCGFVAMGCGVAVVCVLVVLFWLFGSCYYLFELLDFVACVGVVWIWVFRVGSWAWLFV